MYAPHAMTSIANSAPNEMIKAMIGTATKLGDTLRKVGIAIAVYKIINNCDKTGVVRITKMMDL